MKNKHTQNKKATNNEKNGENGSKDLLQLS